MAPRFAAYLVATNHRKGGKTQWETDTNPSEVAWRLARESVHADRQGASSRGQTMETVKFEYRASLDTKLE
jgi:hypothetical protein